MLRFDLRFCAPVVLAITASVAPSQAQAQSTNAGAVTVTVTSSANPSVYAAPVTFTVTVAAPTAGGTTPTGTVTATLLGPYLLGGASLDSTGKAQITVPPQPGLLASLLWGLPAGTDGITFSYLGDSKYNAAQTKFTQFVNKADTTTVAAVNGNGPPVKLTATVSIKEPGASMAPFSLSGVPGTSAPTGTVNFFSGTTLVGTANLVPSGLLTSTAVLLSDPTPTNLSAVYAGDNNYNGSASSNTGGGGGGGAVTLTATSSANPATFAEPVTLKISVTASAAPVPTGSVIASLSGLFTLATVSLDSSGNATLDIPRNSISAGSANAVVPWGLPVGADSITLSYSGDGHYAAAQTTVSQAVTMADTATAATIKNVAGGIFSIAANVSIHENSVTPIAFVLPGNNGASTSPTGVVQFLSGTTVIGKALLVPGGHLDSNAVLILNTAPAATSSITAVYGGDGNYNGSTSPAATQPVTGTANIGVSSSANPSTFAEPVTFNVTVASQTAAGPVPTGLVTATVLGSDILGSAQLDKTGSASFTVPPQNPSSASPVNPWGLATGSNTITLAYSGDGNYSAGKTNFTQLVNPAQTATNLLYPPTAFGIYILMASVKNNENSVSKTDFAIPAGGNMTTSPSGNVTFYDGATAIGSAPLVPGGLFQSTAQLKVASPPANERAVYGGDTNYKGSSSGPAGTGGAPVNVTLAASVPQTIYGGPFTVVAAVTPAGGTGPTPTGTVSFYDGGQSLGWTATLDSTGNGSLTIPIPLATPLFCAPLCQSAEAKVLTAGTHTITVTYSGDANYGAATPSASVTETITKAPTTTSLAGFTASAGLPITGGLVATVADANPPKGGPYHFMIMSASGLADGNPSGAVQFSDGTTANLIPNPSGNVSSNASPSLNGNANLSATYPGDANFQGSSTPAQPTMTLTGNPNPSTVGQSVTLTATVSLANASGDVEFLDGSALLGHSAVSGGVATLAVTFNSPGVHALTAVFSGQPSSFAAVSATFSETVLVTGSQDVLTLSANPPVAVYGQSVTLTAQVAGSVTIPPAGTVNFLDGTTNIGSGTLSAKGVATASVKLGVGLHQLTATWAGDANWKPATSQALSLAVLKASTATTLTMSATTLTAMVAAVKPGAGTPTGTVQFIDILHQMVVGTATLSSGTATLTYTPGSTLASALVAVYSGDADFAPSSSLVSTAPRPISKR